MEKQELTQQEEVALLKAQIAELTRLVKESNEEKAKLQSSVPFGDKIKIVHLMEMAPGLTTRIDLSNLVVVMSKMGEERVLTVQQFEELVGKYRSWFREGILAVSSESEAYARHYGLETDKGLPVKSDFMSKLGDMSMAQLEDIYPRLPHGIQDSILGMWQRKCRAGEAKFADIRKLETLNRLSDGVLTQLIEEENAKRRQSK